MPNSKTRRGRVGKGVAQTLDTQSNQAVIVAQRGRYNEDGKTGQQLEINNEGCTNTITGVQKDNMVIQLSDSKESGGKQPYQQNRVYAKEGVSPTIDSAAGKWQINTDNIRRLTEIECERLQGFSEIKNKIVLVWSEKPKNYANVEKQNHKSQKPALNAERKELNPDAYAVEKNLNLNSQQINKPVLQSVRINLGASIVEIHSQQKLQYYALIAESQKKLIQIENIAPLNATMKLILEKIIFIGKGEFQVNEHLSIHQENGEMHVRLSGNEIMQLASDATKDSIIPKELLKSTTSDHLSNQNLEQILTTLFFYAIRVITGFTQMEIQKGNLLIEINISQGWTQFGCYPIKKVTQKQMNKMSNEELIKLFETTVTYKIPKGQRYKLCGNAVTKNIVELIGRKILQ